MTWEKSKTGVVSSIGLVFFLVCEIAGASSSAARFPGESFEDARNRVLGRSNTPDGRGSSALSVSTPYEKLDLTKLPVITDADAAHMFTQIRDERFLSTPSQPGFSRRISWLYPYDGCWIRAMLASNMSEDKGFARMAKVFAFGSLNVKTPYSTSGEVSWWYHVTGVYQNEAGDAFVFDPSMNNLRPMTLKEWLLAMVPRLPEVKVALCSGHTYGPSDDCSNNSGPSMEQAGQDLVPYLEMEWQNVSSLGKDPQAWLGDMPPWLESPTLQFANRVDF